MPISEATVLSTRTHLWNENGQLSMFISDEGAGYYGYDGNGERAYKLTGYVHRESYNAGEETTRVMLNDAVLYVNPYFIVTPKGYTKHYYNGSQRLATKVFSGVPQWMTDSTEQAESNQAEEYIGEICKKDSVGDSKLSLQCETNMLAKSLTNDIAASGTYYYHGDHLGSCSWITDGNGDIIEHRRYLPYGEEWYRKRFDVSNYVERYTFTGKEKDEESGYYYFGARYYDSRLLTGWLSVDMLSDVDAERTPYNYCKGNPMMLYDPDGNIPMSVISAGVSAVADITIQVAAKYYESGELSTAFHDIKWGSVAVSAASGAVGIGVASKVKQAVQVWKLGKAAAAVTTTAAATLSDAGTSVAGQLITDGKVDKGQLGVDVAAGRLGAGLGVLKANKVINSKPYSLLQKQVDRLGRLTNNGTSGRQSRIDKFNKASVDLQSALDNPVQTRTSATQTGASAIYREATKESKNPED